MLFFVFNWVSISFKNLLKNFNLFFIFFFIYTELFYFLIRIQPKTRCQELKSGNFVNSIGFLHEKSPDPLVRRHYFKRALRKGCVELIILNGQKIREKFRELIITSLLQVITSIRTMEADLLPANLLRPRLLPKVAKNGLQLASVCV